MATQVRKLPRILIRTLAYCYLFAGFLHVLDVFDARLRFSQMEVLWQLWTVYLAFADTLAGFCLLRSSRLGELLFLTLVLSQLAVYLGWSEYFGNQFAWMGFHFLTLSIYLIALTYRQRNELLTERMG